MLRATTGIRGIDSCLALASKGPFARVSVTRCITYALYGSQANKLCKDTYNCRPYVARSGKRLVRPEYVAMHRMCQSDLIPVIHRSQLALGRPSWTCRPPPSRQRHAQAGNWRQSRRTRRRPSEASEALLDTEADHPQFGKFC